MYPRGPNFALINSPPSLPTLDKCNSPSVVKFHNVESALYLCKDYKDTRFPNGIDLNNVTTIIQEDFIFIPNNLMSNEVNETFGLMNSSQPLRCSNPNKTTLNLAPETVFKKTQSIQSLTTSKPTNASKRNKNAMGKPHILRGKIGPHFTPEGYFEYDHFYYKPQDFCLSSISNDEVEVEMCPVNCAQDGNLCLPKCCGIGEVMVYWNWTCQKTSESWKPYLYEDVHTRLPEEKLKKLEIHYSRPFLNCPGPPTKNGKPTAAWTPWSFSEVKRPKIVPRPPDPGLIIRVLKDGSIMHLFPTRRWEKISEGMFCIDGFVNWGLGGNATHLIDEQYQVVLRCPLTSELANGRTDDLYAGVLYLASVFILLTAVVHILLYDRQNIHGLTVLSQCISLFFFYLTHGTVYIIAQRRDPTKDYRSPMCLSIAILSHFFFLTTFAWLTVVNFDLWLTFRSMRPISKMSKKMRRFRLYSLLGWGVPFLIMSVFVFLDFHYWDYRTEVIVPDYGRRSCYVSSWARREYICSVLSATIPVNILLIISTFKIFYDFEKGANVLPKRAKGDKNSFKLFIKLFLVMGSIWGFDAVFCWIYNTGEQSPWYIMVIDCAMFLQAIAIFVIFCCNRRTMKQLEDKFPCFRSVFSPIRKVLKIQENTTEMTDTTPATPGNSRKMSTFSTSSVKTGTMERRKV